MYNTPPLIRRRQEHIAEAMLKLNTKSEVKVWKSPRLAESVKQKTSSIIN